MARSQSRLASEIDFDRDGKQHGFIRLPHSVHRSAYGWIPIPVASVKNGDGPRWAAFTGAEEVVQSDWSGLKEGQSVEVKPTEK